MTRAAGAGAAADEAADESGGAAADTETANAGRGKAKAAQASIAHSTPTHAARPHAQPQLASRRGMQRKEKAMSQSSPEAAPCARPTPAAQRDGIRLRPAGAARAR